MSAVDKAFMVFWLVLLVVGLLTQDAWICFPAAFFILLDRIENP